MIADFPLKIKMRIAMIGAKGIPTSSFSQGGGIERHVEMLAEYLVRRGHQVSVYVRPYANREGKRRWNGVRLITLPTIHSKHLDAIFHVLLCSIHVLFQKTDIVHYHGVGPSLLSWIPRLFKWRAKVVATFHSRDRFHEKWNWFARGVLAIGEWTTCTFPHLTITVSHGLQLFCRKMYERDAVYIPNGVEIPKRSIATTHLKKLGIHSGEYYLILARLIRLKAQDDAIRAFASLPSSKKLLLVGEPSPDEMEYYVKLQELAERDHRVILMGFRSGEELRQLLAHCYCMIHPSRTEGLSVAILEAMSYGRLVLMSDIPENRELVDHSGVAFPVGNVHALADTLTWLDTDPLLVRTRGERARAVIQRLYSWEHIVERTEHEFHKLLSS